jgi:hypothetical protein
VAQQAARGTGSGTKGHVATQRAHRRPSKPPEAASGGARARQWGCPARAFEAPVGGSHGRQAHAIHGAVAAVPASRPLRRRSAGRQPPRRSTRATRERLWPPRAGAPARRSRGASLGAPPRGDATTQGQPAPHTSGPPATFTTGGRGRPEREWKAEGLRRPGVATRIARFARENVVKAGGNHPITQSPNHPLGPRQRGQRGARRTPRWPRPCEGFRAEWPSNPRALGHRRQGDDSGAPTAGQQRASSGPAAGQQRASSGPAAG